MLPPELSKFPNEVDDLQRDLFRKYNNRVVFNRTLSKPAGKPGRKFALKQRFRDCFIDYPCSRIKCSLHAVAVNDSLAKTVDCRGGQFVKSRCRCSECRLLLIGEAGRERGLDEIGDVARQERFHRFPDAMGELAGSEVS